MPSWITGRPATIAPSGSRARSRPSAGSRTTSTLSSVATASAHSPLAQARPGAFLRASSAPTLGQLYPLSDAFSIDPDGRVGIGTATPSEKLHIWNHGSSPEQMALRIDTDSPRVQMPFPVGFDQLPLMEWRPRSAPQIVPYRGSQPRSSKS